MNKTFVVTLLSVAAIALLFAVIDVFGILPALATLSLYVGIACVIAVRPQRI